MGKFQGLSKTSGAKDKQATRISETRDGPHFVASHFFNVPPILVLMNLSWRLNLCLCVKPFITWIRQTIKKWLATKEDPSRVSLMWVACLFRASLSCLFVFSARRGRGTGGESASTTRNPDWGASKIFQSPTWRGTGGEFPSASRNPKWGGAEHRTPPRDPRAAPCITMPAARSPVGTSKNFQSPTGRGTGGESPKESIQDENLQRNIWLLW